MIDTRVKVILEPTLAWKPDLEVWIRFLQLLMNTHKKSKINTHTQVTIFIAD